MDELLLKRLERAPSLPTLPVVAQELLDLCDREDVDLSAIAAKIACDPSLAARLLRVTNTAMYAPRQAVRTVERATAVLGAHAVRSLALSFSLIDVMKARTGGFPYEAYWRRSLLSAVAARELARLMEGVNPDEAFLVGLLQDIGMLALARVLGTPYAELYSSAGVDHGQLLVLERARLNTTHVEVGLWLIERWRLPESFTVSMAATSEENPVGHSPLELIAAASGALADVWLAGASEESLKRLDVLETRHPTLARLSLSAFAGMAAGAFTVAELLGVDLGRDWDPEMLLDRARDALVRQCLRTSHLATVDGLTGVLNRAQLDSEARRLFERAHQLSHPISLLFCDVDHFKAVNDRYGHAAGDAVLTSLAAELGGQVRNGDVVGRYGGEEFMLVLPGTPRAGARIVADRVRERIEASLFETPDQSPVHVTLSVGVATDDGAKFPTFAKLSESADRALRAAKTSGRNRVVEAPPT